MKTVVILVVSALVSFIACTGCEAAISQALAEPTLPVKTITGIQAVSLRPEPRLTSLTEGLPTPNAGEVATRPAPAYYGMRLDIVPEAGFGVWLPVGWTRLELEPGLVGAQYLPSLEDQQIFFTHRTHLQIGSHPARRPGDSAPGYDG